MKHDAPGKLPAKRLARALDVSPLYAALVIESLHAFAVREVPTGDLTDLWEDYIFEAETLPALNTSALKDALLAAGVLGESDGRLIISDWPEHAPLFVHTSLARTRQLFANGAKPKPGKMSASERESYSVWHPAEPVGHPKESAGHPAEPVGGITKHKRNIIERNEAKPKRARVAPEVEELQSQIQSRRNTIIEADFKPIVSSSLHTHRYDEVTP